MFQKDSKGLMNYSPVTTQKPSHQQTAFKMQQERNQPWFFVKCHSINPQRTETPNFTETHSADWEARHCPEPP